MQTVEMRYSRPNTPMKRWLPTRQFMRNFIQRKRILLRHLPDPFPQQGHLASGPASSSDTGLPNVKQNAFPPQAQAAAAGAAPHGQ